MGAHIPSHLSPTSQPAVLAPVGAEDFQGGRDNGEAKEEPASSFEAESLSQSAKDDDESGGDEDSKDASESQPESAEDRGYGGIGKGSAAEFTSAENVGESGA